ncbi:hypothetical protein ACLMJK_005078 [Lecanora helva]
MSGMMQRVLAWLGRLVDEWVEVEECMMPDNDEPDTIEPDNDESDVIESDLSGFQSFEHAAADIVLAVSFNPPGTKVVLCSADHKIRVYTVDKDKEWNLLDQFRGHDAAVLDVCTSPLLFLWNFHSTLGKVQWVSSPLGQFFATIGGDNKFKIWQEDLSQRPNNGRRFRCVYMQTPPNHVSYVSFGFKVIKTDTYLALFTHDGSLSLHEPADPESYQTWNQIDQLFPFGQHHRGTEARFRLSIHQAVGPSSNALRAGMDSKTLSLAVSALSAIKILRAMKGEETNYQFYEMLEFDIGNNVVINEVAWAPGCLYPFDVIAAACDDGTVRIFHVDTPGNVDDDPTVTTGPRSPDSSDKSSALSSTSRNTPSGIGAGLAGMSLSTPARQNVPDRALVKHVAKEVAVLPHDEGSPVWKIRWMYDGSALVSTGDSGKVHLWKEDIDGEFIEYAETGPT